MKPDDIKRIRKTQEVLLQNLRAKYIWDDLFAKGIIDEKEKETIKAGDTHFTQTRRLLNFLMLNQSDDIFERFCKVLRECDAKYGYLADELESADISDMKEEPVVDETDSLSLVHKLLEQIALDTEKFRMILQSQEKLQDHFNQLQDRCNQLTERLNQAPISHDVVDSRPVGIYIYKDYVEQYCTTERPPTGATVQSNSGAGVPDEYSFPSAVWNTIRSTVNATGGRNNEIGLIIQEIACRLGADVIQHTILSRYRNAIRFSSSNSIKPSSSVHFTEQESAVYTEASCLMKALVVNLLTEKASEFNKMVGQLDISKVDGYNTFGVIADEMFGRLGDADHESEMNWGRVLMWYAFWAHYAFLPVDDKLEENVEVYGRYVGFFLARRLNSWLINAQGWEGFNKRYRKPSNSNSTGYGSLMWRVVTEMWRQLPL